jgi:hypothetical protein
MTGKREFTIDEWFYHLLAREDSYKATAALLIKIFEVCDKIVLKQGTRLAHKFYDLDFESGKWNPAQRQIVKFVKRAFLDNANKIKWVEEDVVFPEEIETQLPRKDVYLVKICSQSAQKLLITTDQTLYDQLLALKDALQITPVMLPVFSEAYLNDKWK